MHTHTQFGIPTSKNKGDMDWHESGTDGQIDGRTVRLLYASQSSFGGIKNGTPCENPTFVPTNEPV